MGDLNVYTYKPNDVKLNNPAYLQLLNIALSDKDCLCSFGLDILYRKLGEYYEAANDKKKPLSIGKKQFK